MKHLICPTDFSKTAENAGKFAAGLARSIGAKMTLLHVMHVPVVDSNSAVVAPADHMKEQEKESVGRLNTIAAELRSEYGIEVDAQACFGLAAEAISDKEDDLNADMVVMGTNGASGNIEKWLGTVSYAVSKNSNNPVLVVPPDVTFTDMNTVMLADDHEENLVRVKEFLQKLHPKENQIIHAVSVEETGVNGDYKEEVVTMTETEKVVCVWGEDLVDALSKYANVHQADLIAVKRHKRNFIESLFHKSATKAILNEMKIPVLVFN